ncbi:MAG: Bug family tripartite tricarboxylate transporter substrate binding protein [Burkholderiales bacterium]
MVTAKLKRFRASLIAAVWAFAIPALAATYPERPVRIIVPSAPGGGTDATTRILAPELTKILGQQFVVDNRAGASGNIGAEIALRAPADGYTLLATLSSHATNPLVMKNVSYDLERDFAPISRTVVVPNVILSHPSLPPKTTRELIAFVKARPGQLNFASPGLGTNPHLTMELFLAMAGLKVTAVHYKGIGPAVTDVLAGHLPLASVNLLIASPHIKAGKIRAYGVTSARRSNSAPELPTIAESGVPGFEAVQWFGLLAPANTPRDIVARLHAAVLQALQDPVVSKRFLEGGAEPTPSKSPEEFGAVIRDEIRKWAKVIKAAGIRAE